MEGPLEEESDRDGPAVRRPADAAPAPFEQQVTFLYVRDPEVSYRFYGGTLGLPLVLDQGLARIYRVGSGEAFLGICKASSVQQPRSSDNAPDRAPLGLIFTFVTQDVDGWYETLRAKGVVFEKAPQKNETYRIYNCFFRDPDGYLLEIQRFLSPEWKRPASRP